MYCLRWWLPLFVLPFPAAPPLFLILFVLSYTVQTRPCIYCGAIIFLLLATSCNWYTASTPVQFSSSSLFSSDVRVAFGMTRVLEWLGNISAPSAAIAPPESLPTAPDAICAHCWMSIPFRKLWSFFDLTPRMPQCADGKQCFSVGTDTPRSSHLFLGVPGTSLGYALEWSMFLPRA